MKNNKPVIVLPTGKTSQADIRLLRRNGYCVIEAEDTTLVRYLEPPPLDCEPHEKAAIILCRHLLRTEQRLISKTGEDIRALYASIIIKGTSLDFMPAPQAPVSVRS
jgi:hypothetical protein